MCQAFTEKEVAELLNVSVSKLRRDRWLNLGIPYTKLGRAVRYMADDVESVILHNRVETSK